MNKALEEMLRSYDPSTPAEWQQATREVSQEIALLGFWRSGFFEHAAFYGGTTLRIFHGLRRFSEDLDFSLLDPASDARLERALPAVETELAAWGLSFEAEPKSAGDRTGIESAFLKGNTRLNLLHVGVPEELSRRFHRNNKITIKLELDTNPPLCAATEVRTRLLPVPYTVRLYDLPSLFAGKLHAVLFRDWKSRVKGRDFYDFVWYVSRDIPVNLKHLEARMRQGGYDNPAPLTIDGLRNLLADRIRAIDVSAAAEEVRPFLRDVRETALWSSEFFFDLCTRIRTSSDE